MRSTAWPRGRRVAAVVLLLDTSFFSVLIAERLRRQAGPATALLRSHPGKKTVVSIVTVAEYLEYARAPESALSVLRMHSLVGISLEIAKRCAVLQRRLTQRLGENDAWLAATALQHDFTLVSSDQDFARVPRLAWINFKS